jgi:hypothetical protein
MRAELTPLVSPSEPGARRASEITTSPPALGARTDGHDDDAGRRVAAHLAAPRRRRVTAWDGVGILLLATVMVIVDTILVDAAGTELGRSPGLRQAGAIVVWATVVAFAGVVVWDRPRLAAIPMRVTQVWRDPPGAWVAFVLGFVVAIPVMGLYSSVLFSDSDSSRLLASVGYVRSGGWDYFVDTQEPYLPPLLLSPVTALWGLAGAKMFAIVSVQVLTGTTAMVAYRVSRSMWGALAAAVGLLCISGVLERSVKMPMYGVMLTLGYLGAWWAYRAISEPDRVWRFALPAGVCLALAQEGHGIGQLFLAVPLLLVIVAPTLRSGIWGMVRLYVVVVATMIPRIVINLSDGGLEYVTSPRTDYWITQGYVTQIQTEFWSYRGINESAGEWLAEFPDRFVTLLGDQGGFVVALALAGALLFCRGRTRAFVVACFGFLLLAVTLKRIPPFARYYAPFWPGMAVLAGVAAGWFMRRRFVPVRVLPVALVGVLLVGASGTLRDAAETYDQDRALVEQEPARLFAEEVDDGKGVIGARAHQFFFSVTVDVPTWGDQFLTEEEYVTYLTWPSTREVLEVFERHDIGWVYIAPRRFLETQYNDTWLLPHHDRPARHIAEIAYNPSFCRWLEVGNYVLFRVGPCPDGGLSRDGYLVETDDEDGGDGTTDAPTDGSDPATDPGDLDGVTDLGGAGAVQEPVPEAAPAPGAPPGGG